MSRDRVMEVELLNLSQNYAVFTNGWTLPITDYFDDDGEACEADAAVYCVAGDETHGWLAISIEPACEWATIH